MPFGNPLFVMVSPPPLPAAEIVIVNVCCCELVLSLTCTVNENIPAAVGVPLIVPDEALRVRPDGSLPIDTCQT